jgi:signal transduction histidine kinase/CheY-like chemotaxis protein
MSSAAPPPSRVIPVYGSRTLVRGSYSRSFSLDAILPSKLTHNAGRLRLDAASWQSETNLRLRTKFLLSLALIITGLTFGTLLIVRRTAEARAQREIKAEALNAILTFQVLQQQHQAVLSRKADLLASLALMRNGDPTAIQEVADDPWHSDECDLLILADPTGKIVALDSRTAEFPLAVAQETLSRSLKAGSTIGWWYSGTNLYQVVLQPFFGGTQAKSDLSGTVVVGHRLNPVNELGHTSSSHLAFRYGSNIVASTLSPLKERELGGQLGARAGQEVNIDGERFFASSAELLSGPPPISIIVLKSYTEVLLYQAKQNQLLAAMGLVAILTGGVLVFLISDRFTRPLGHLVEGVRALERGDFAYPLEARGSDEVAHVTRAFDRMRNTLKNNASQKQQLEDQLRQSQKMEAVGQLAGGVAHDFNNLLTVIKGHGCLILDQLQPADPLYGSASKIDKAADRAGSLTRQLLAFSRMQVLQPKVLDLNTLVAEMCSLLKRLVREDICFTFRAGQSLARVKADPGQIEQVLMNLTVNACDAMPKGGKLTVETTNVTVDAALAKTHSPMRPGEYVRLSVEDTGHGMDASTKARIFEPFFTTKELGKGTGLGLATVYGVVKQSGGCIWVTSEPGEGARFEVYLPVVHEVEDLGPHRTVTEPTRRSETVLIVEDEEAVRELASEFMKSAGYTVLTARDGQEALAIAVRSASPIQVLLTDVVMPNMRGPELAKRLKALSADLQIVYMSGYLEYDKGKGDSWQEGFFLQKPFSRETLVSKVAEALRRERIAIPSTL